MASPSAASTPRASSSAASSGSTILVARDLPTAPSSGASRAPALLRRADLHAERHPAPIHRQVHRRAAHEVIALAGNQHRDRGVLRHDDLLRAAVVVERELASLR